MSFDGLDVRLYCTCSDNKLTGAGGGGGGGEAGGGKDTGIVAGADGRMGGRPVGGAGGLETIKVGHA